MRIEQSAFADQLRTLKQFGEFIALDHLKQPPAGSGPRFLVTFDDGYRNNLTLAAPILADLGIPALFFISTAHTRSGELFWLDVISLPVFHAKIRTLDFREFGLGTYHFRHGDNPQTWDDLAPIFIAMKSRGDVHEGENARLITWMREEYSDVLALVYEGYRPLDSRDLRTLTDDPLFKIGSHADRHVDLTSLDSDAVRDELSVSRSFLREISGECQTLAYPYGRYTDQVQELVAKAGYDFAFTTRRGLVEKAESPWAVPRILIGGFDSPAFLQRKLCRTLARNLLPF